MDKYSNCAADCTEKDENNSADDLDLSSLDELIYELTHMNGRACVAPPKRDEAAELAALEAEFDALTEFVAGLDDE
ncbi:hypothetical protein Snov_2072 [Ancylobacter novellus DSM 506]|uniref:Uncharacterized protein n=1 Tax=Ancylobacter novellus (strain ATCC 8093 / DSM 506 / JCM 20403 / CCM 1077 / IAM 12100 / NBRC 12443 / NCIMB 10456) TaxID=639283 RepID=D7A0A9_ANCN5|nr:hypothetical protein [Ancylobacter novellus]ADH89370.1 hypothetical protein Snov_2072 [Ancylobacter novellus DSM 506]